MNYCYCSRDSCNTPDRRLLEPDQTKPLEGPPRHRQGHELPLSPPQSSGGIGHHSAKASAAAPVDDEDAAKDGSGDGDWESFYYDSYYDGGRGGGGVGGPAAGPGNEGGDDDDEEEDENEDAALGPNSHGGLGPDTEPGLAGGPAGDYADMTDPPPFVEQQLEEELAQISKNRGGGSQHKYDRGGNQDVEFVEDFMATSTTHRPSIRRTSAGVSHRDVSAALLAVCLTASARLSWR